MTQHLARYVKAILREPGEIEQSRFARINYGPVTVIVNISGGRAERGVSSAW